MAWYKRAFTTKTVVNSEETSKLQSEWTVSMGDFQRAPTDAYMCYAHLSETLYKVSVSLTVVTQHSGMIMLQIFWKYGLDEKTQAKKTFEGIKKAISEIVEEITINEAPSALFESMIRSDCSKIDTSKIAKTNIPHINWSQQTTYERDWRSTLYGNRYPTPNETNGF